MGADSDATKQAVIPYPAGLPQVLKLSDGEFARELRFLAAAKLYELGRLSSGKAVGLAGLLRQIFRRPFIPAALRALKKLPVPPRGRRSRRITKSSPLSRREGREDGREALGE